MQLAVIYLNSELRLPQVKHIETPEGIMKWSLVATCIIGPSVLSAHASKTGLSFMQLMVVSGIIHKDQPN